MYMSKKQEIAKTAYHKNITSPNFCQPWMTVCPPSLRPMLYPNLKNVRLRAKKGHLLSSAFVIARELDRLFTLVVICISSSIYLPFPFFYPVLFLLRSLLESLYMCYRFLFQVYVVLVFKIKLIKQYISLVITM